MLTAHVPTLAGGQGSMTELQLRIGRRFSYRGARRSFLSAACAAPPGFPGATFAFARGIFSFDGGRTMHATLSRNCQVRDPGESGYAVPSTQPKGRTMNEIDPKLRRLGALLAVVAAIGGGALLPVAVAAATAPAAPPATLRRSLDHREQRPEGSRSGVEGAESGIEETKEKGEEALEEAEEKFEDSKGKASRTSKKPRKRPKTAIEEAKKKAEELLP